MVVLDGEIVVIGGFDDVGRMVDRVEAYDPATDTWRSLARLPLPSHHVNAAVVDGVLWVVGVLQAGFQETATAWRYDPGPDTWTMAEPAPFDLAVGASVTGTVAGLVHVVGGLQSNDTVSVHAIYDPATDAWTFGPDVPTARDHAAGAVIDGGLWVAGGRDGGIFAVTDAVERFDPQTNTWTTFAAIPTARAGGAASVDAEGRWHVVGGEGNPDDASGVFAEHEVYDPATDTWASRPPMLTPRHGMGAAFLDGVLYVPGGATRAGFGALDTFEAWSPED